MFITRFTNRRMDRHNYMTKSKLPVVQEIQKEITKQLANKEVMTALISTTFKGLNESSVKQAITEGMMRGFEFKDFLEKNVYAIPFSNSYSLITSIDHAKKVGAKNGVVGKLPTTWEVSEEGKLVSCTVTVQKKTGDHIGEYAETVYFDEYNTNRNLWTSKPRTMIEKVAYMHALRSACPEELSQSYAEEEMQKEIEPAISDEDMIAYEEQIESVKTLDELKTIFSALPFEAKQKLEKRKDELKKKLK